MAFFTPRSGVSNLATLSDEDLADLASQALEDGDWDEARDLLDRLCLRGARVEIPSLAETSAGPLFATRRPAYARLLSDRIRECRL
jgi:hypothetical protein